MFQVSMNKVYAEQMGIEKSISTLRSDIFDQIREDGKEIDDYLLTLYDEHDRIVMTATLHEHLN